LGVVSFVLPIFKEAILNEEKEKQPKRNYRKLVLFLPRAQGFHKAVFTLDFCLQVFVQIVPHIYSCPSPPTPPYPIFIPIWFRWIKIDFCSRESRFSIVHQELMCQWKKKTAWWLFCVFWLEKTFIIKKTRPFKFCLRLST